jgi:hypothetical protein
MFSDPDFLLDAAGLTADFVPQLQVPATVAEGIKVAGDVVQVVEVGSTVVKGLFYPITVQGFEGQNGRRLGPFREKWTNKEIVNAGLDLVSVVPVIGGITSAIGVFYNASFYISFEKIE